MCSLGSFLLGPGAWCPLSSLCHSLAPGCKHPSTSLILKVVLGGALLDPLPLRLLVQNKTQQRNFELTSSWPQVSLSSLWQFWQLNPGPRPCQANASPQSYSTIPPSKLQQSASALPCTTPSRSSTHPILTDLPITNQSPN